VCACVNSKKLSVARDLFSQTHTEGVPLLVSCCVFECRLQLVYCHCSYFYFATLNS